MAEINIPAQGGPDEPLPIILATVGVGVPVDDVPLLAGVVVEEAARIGYRHLRVEGSQVTGQHPYGPQIPTQGRCPACSREISRYPGGRFYRHRCSDGVYQGRGDVDPR